MFSYIILNPPLYRFYTAQVHYYTLTMSKKYYIFFCCHSMRCYCFINIFSFNFFVLFNKKNIYATSLLIYELMNDISFFSLAKGKLALDDVDGFDDDAWNMSVAKIKEDFLFCYSIYRSSLCHRLHLVAVFRFFSFFSFLSAHKSCCFFFLLSFI